MKNFIKSILILLLSFFLITTTFGLSEYEDWEGKIEIEKYSNLSLSLYNNVISLGDFFIKKYSIYNELYRENKTNILLSKLSLLKQERQLTTKQIEIVDLLGYKIASSFGTYTGISTSTGTLENYMNKDCSAAIIDGYTILFGKLFTTVDITKQGAIIGGIKSLKQTFECNDGIWNKYGIEAVESIKCDDGYRKAPMDTCNLILSCKSTVIDGYDLKASTSAPIISGRIITYIPNGYNAYNQKFSCNTMTGIWSKYGLEGFYQVCDLGYIKSGDTCVKSFTNGSIDTDGTVTCNYIDGTLSPGNNTISLSGLKWCQYARDYQILGIPEDQVLTSFDVFNSSKLDCRFDSYGKTRTVEQICTGFNLYNLGFISYSPSPLLIELDSE